MRPVRQRFIALTLQRGARQYLGRDSLPHQIHRHVPIRVERRVADHAGHHRRLRLRRAGDDTHRSLLRAGAVIPEPRRRCVHHDVPRICIGQQPRTFEVEPKQRGSIRPALQRVQRRQRLRADDTVCRHAARRLEASHASGQCGIIAVAIGQPQSLTKQHDTLAGRPRLEQWSAGHQNPRITAAAVTRRQRLAKLHVERAHPTQIADIIRHRLGQRSAAQHVIRLQLGRRERFLEVADLDVRLAHVPHEIGKRAAQRDLKIGKRAQIAVLRLVDQPPQAIGRVAAWPQPIDFDRLDHVDQRHRLRARRVVDDPQRPIAAWTVKILEAPTHLTADCLGNRIVGLAGCRLGSNGLGDGDARKRHRRDQHQ